MPDRQAAEAVRGRIDWKYALALSLTDPGSDSTVLSEFRSRLVEGRAEQVLLDAVLALAEVVLRPAAPAVPGSSVRWDDPPVRPLDAPVVEDPV